MINNYRRLRAGVGARLVLARLALMSRDDRGEIPSNVAWAGGMLVIAVSAVGVISGKVGDFVDNLSFGP
jgi:hypothetical protein